MISKAFPADSELRAMRPHSHESSTELASGLVSVLAGNSWRRHDDLKSFPADSELRAMRPHSHESSTEAVAWLVAMLAGNFVEEA